MRGFPKYVDRNATLAMLNKHTREASKELKEELDLDLEANPKSKAVLHNILAGSVRANSRLTKSHGVKPLCRCGAGHKDIAHVFQH